jgi:hypothetical protein
MIATGVLIVLMSARSASAETPCDFKGLSVGDRATPQQIMQHFGIHKFTDEDITKMSAADLAKWSARSRAKSDAFFKRIGQVGMKNALEEEYLSQGPTCDTGSCRISSGVNVGNGPDAILVGVSVYFDNAGVVTAIEVSYSKDDWDAVLQLMNTKYGEEWASREYLDFTADPATNKSTLGPVTAIMHRTNGTNLRTGDGCTIKATSQDDMWRHTTPPVLRARLEIELVSKNF